MAFRHNRVGILVATDPEAAVAELRRLFGKHRTMEAVSKALEVDRHTIPRWIKSLTAAGHPDPREAVAAE